MVTGEYLALGGFSLSIVTTLIVTSWRAGRIASEINHAHKEVARAVSEVKELRDDIGKIGSLEKSIEFLKEATSRNTSDIRELMKDTGHLRGRLDSNHEGEE